MGLLTRLDHYENTNVGKQERFLHLLFATFKHRVKERSGIRQIMERKGGTWLQNAKCSYWIMSTAFASHVTEETRYRFDSPDAFGPAEYHGPLGVISG